MTFRFQIRLTLLFVLLFFVMHGQKSQDHSEGPFNQMIIRGATLINGNGAPPTGPVDIVVEGNRITEVRVVGYPGVEIKDSSRPVLKRMDGRSTQKECTCFRDSSTCTATSAETHRVRIQNTYSDFGWLMESLQ